MKGITLTTVLIAATVASFCPPGCAQGEASVLMPITPIEVEPWNREVLIAAGDAGRVMVAFLGEMGDEYVAWSATTSGGGWSNCAVPMTPGDTAWRSHVLRDLAPGAGGRFILLYTNQSSHHCYTIWSGSQWEAPVPVPEETLDHPDGVCFDAAGNVLLWDDDVPGYFARHSGGQWQSLRLPQRIEDVTGDSRGELTLGRDGAVHLLGNAPYKVPTVASCPPGADPTQPASWVFVPGASSEHRSPLYPGVYEPQTSLDWPRQMIWACWGYDDRLMVSHAPIGTTTSEGWTTWPVSDESWLLADKSLASSSAGADGVVYRIGNGHGVYQILFHWLPPNGPGAPVQIARPGSQTEAADFTQFNTGTLSMCIAPDGVAHIVVKGKKRGEYPENADRIYYSRVTGGAVLQSEPSVTGGSTEIADGQTGGQTGGQAGGQTGGQQQDWQQQGGKPDLVPVLALSTPPYRRDGQEVYRFGYSDRVVRPEVAIRNIASQYFGDVELDLVMDGVVIHYTRHDDSDRMRPLIERDGTLTVYNLPALSYQYLAPEQAWSPPELTLADSLRSQFLDARSGLGRKTATLIIDPANKIDEENEENNTAEVVYEITDGREQADRLNLRGMRDDLLIVGSNDLSIRSTTLAANTRIAGPGMIQAPTTAEVLIANEAGATFFRNVAVAALIDGAEVWRATIPLIDGEYRLHNSEVAARGWPGATERRGADIRGGLLEVPVDLTDVSVGAHTLTIIVDPDDAFADLQRDNNAVTVPLRVREAGGTLLVQVRDAGSGQGVSMAHVLLGNLFFDRTDASGRLTIADVPAGSYDPRDLWCSRPWPDPRYAGQPCEAPFTVRTGETTQVAARLEQPVTVHLTITDARTGQPLDAPPSAGIEWSGQTPWGTSDSGEVVGWRQGNSELVFPDVRPGPCTITADAWAYQPATLPADVHRDARGECRLQLSLQQAPRGNVQVTVTDGNGRGVPGALVFLQSAPRAAGTDASGVALISGVEAGSAFTVVAKADGFSSGSATTGTVAAGQTQQCAIQIARITSRERSVSFDAIAWAQCESWPGFSFGPVSSDGYEVSAEHGRFHATLAMNYHEIAGTGRGVVDELIVASDGGPFWSENITYEYSLTDLLCSGVGVVAGEKIAQFVKLAGPINDVYDWFNGDLDPNRLHEGEVVGSYSSWTETEYASETLIPLPSIEFSPGMSGGQTVVRADIVEITDGTTTKTIQRQWYSPSMMVYRIGEEFDLSTLEVKIYLAVLNERLSPGPLYASSRNLIHWKPMEGDGEDAWLSFHPQPYDALGLD